MGAFAFLGFGIDAWITIITVFCMFTTLLLTKLRTDVVFLAVIGLLFVTGVLDAKEAYSGFSSTSVVVIGVLFIVVVEEAGHRAVEIAHPAELRLWHGRRLHSYRHAAEPDHQRPLCR